MTAARPAAAGRAQSGGRRGLTVGPGGTYARSVIRKDQRPRAAGDASETPFGRAGEAATDVYAAPGYADAPGDVAADRPRTRRTSAPARAADEQPPEDAPATPPSLPSVAVAGLSRKRLAWIVACVVAGWILLTFARQVGEAADATARADRARAENGSIAAELARLQGELAYIQQPRFVAQQARAYGVGGRREHPFTLQVGSPPLPADAPGSASQRVGYRATERSPLQAWIQVLFGPAPGS